MATLHAGADLMDGVVSAQAASAVSGERPEEAPDKVPAEPQQVEARKGQPELQRHVLAAELVCLGAPHATGGGTAIAAAERAHALAFALSVIM